MSYFFDPHQLSLNLNSRRRDRYQVVGNPLGPHAASPSRGGPTPFPSLLLTRSAAVRTDVSNYDLFPATSVLGFDKCGAREKKNTPRLLITHVRGARESRPQITISVVETYTLVRQCEIKRQRRTVVLTLCARKTLMGREKTNKNLTTSAPLYLIRKRRG